MHCILHYNVLESLIIILKVPEFQGEPDDISKEKCKIAAKEVDFYQILKAFDLLLLPEFLGKVAVVRHLF